MSADTSAVGAIPGAPPAAPAAPVARAPAKSAPAPAAQAPERQPARVSHARAAEETARAIAAQIESYLHSIGRSLEFSVDKALGRTVITVRDVNGEIIRQIPNEEALRLARAMRENAAVLLDVTV